MLRVNLFLVGYKGFDALKHILSHVDLKFINSVVIGQDQGVSNDFSSELIDLCSTFNLAYQIRDQEYQANLTGQSDVIALCIGWKWILPVDQMIIVLHDSLLPRYRGFAPLVSQLIAGETCIGVTAIQATENYDCGPIICTHSIPIAYPIKISVAIKQITACYRACVDTVFAYIESSTDFPLEVQDESLATYSLWRDHSDYFVNWSSNSSFIKRFVDAVGDPYDGAMALLNGQQIKIHDVEIVSDVIIANRVPGKVIFMREGCPVVVCGTGLVKIIQASTLDGKSILPLLKFRSRFS